MGSGEKNIRVAGAVAVAGVAYILMVACCVSGLPGLLFNDDEGPIDGVVSGSGGGILSPRNLDDRINGLISAATKSTKTICAPTDYKETCERSLAGVTNIHDPRELIKAAFTTAVENINNAITKSSELFKEDADKDPRISGALDTCKAVLHHSVDDLTRCFDKAEDFQLTKIKDYANDIRVWLSGAITLQQTCIDAFQNTTGNTGETMKHLLKIPGELTSDGLAMITHFTDLLHTVKIPGLHHGLNHRLLEAEGEFPHDGACATRRLLTADPASIKPDIVVAKDGSGQYKTINDALSAVPTQNNRTFVIFIKAGVYNEYVVVPRNMNKIVFLGEGPTKTRITGNKNYKDGTGTYQTATVAIEGDGFMARDIGFENSAGPEKHQAVALRVTADMTMFYNCHIDAYQDTLYTHAYRQYYRDCTITGTIDFIFGDGAAVFQNCKMVVRKPLENQACMVTAQGRIEHNEVGGIVLQNCSILPDPALEGLNPPAKVYLGRPWKEFSRTVVMQSYIDGFVAPEGWAPWDGEFALDTLWYAEYENRGPGASTVGRVNWKGYKKDISAEIAQQFTPGVYVEGDEWIKPSGIPYESGMMQVCAWQNYN
ncbi:PREDICTED: pectinesterase-like [Ipomoea nil]|uniref:pectinesterase-like n=1 Tax=Ipomoea nil TaxID=35883 RepID=UPI000901B72C|nr:PREDICTED: pectinesterase-like [Ipomoea nil]